MRLTITIASAPELEQVYAELSADAQNWADLTQEDGVLKLEIYPNPTGQPWVFDLDSLRAHLHEARRALLNDAGVENNDQDTSSKPHGS